VDFTNTARGGSMNILTRYIVKEVLKGSFLALLLLLTLFNLYTFSDEVKDLGKGSYQLKEILLYLSLNTPSVFYELVPSGALIGSIFVLGAMANNSEITAMRAAGLSVFGIIRAVLLAGVILVAVSVAIGEFIAPDAERLAQKIRSTAQNDKVIIKAKYGIWLREGNSFVNIRKITGKDTLTDVSFYYLDKNYRLKQVKHAEAAQFIGKDQWLLKNIQTTELFDDKVQPGFAQTAWWQTSIAPDLVDIAVVTASTLSSYELIKYVDFLKDNNQKSQVFEAALWARLLNPFVTFVMLLVAAPFVLGIKRGTSVGERLIVGIVLGLSFKILDQITSHVGVVYDFNPLLMAVLPSSFVLIATIYAINRLKT
jgi:lipopolysaccharide export system permease protein